MKFDVRFEHDVVAQALKDVVFLKKAVRSIEARHFSNRSLAWVWKILEVAWRDHREVPSIQYLGARVKKEFTEVEDRVKYIEMLKGLYKNNPATPNIVLEEMIDFVRMTELHKGMERAISAIEEDKIDDAYGVVRDVLKSDRQARDFEVVSWSEEFQQRQSDRIYKRENPEEFVCVPTGIIQLDRIIQGIQPGELALMMATTGRGKSITLANIAYYAAKMGYATLYLALEMPASQIAQRIDSRWSGYEYNKFKTCDFNFEEIQSLEVRNQKIQEQFKNKLKIASMPLRKCDINSIASITEALHDEDGFVPQLLIADSADHMQPLKSRRDHRFEASDIYWDLKSFGQENGHAIWTSTQAGRDYAEKLATAEATSESYDKARIADVICSINKPQQQSRSTVTASEYSFLGDEFSGDETPNVELDGRRLEMYLAKYRDGESSVTIPLETDFARMLVKGAEEEGESFD